MGTRIRTKDFEEIYRTTYQQVLKFIVIKCNDIDDVNDVIQDTYIELLNLLKKKKILEIDNTNSYIIGIANNMIKRYYFKKKKTNVISVYSENDHDMEVKDSFDLEQNIITKENVGKVWEYIKNKDLNTVKIFYLYFSFGLKIAEIARELKLTESNVKNKIYRTLKEMKKYLGEEVERND